MLRRRSGPRAEGHGNEAGEQGVGAAGPHHTPELGGEEEGEKEEEGDKMDIDTEKDGCVCLRVLAIPFLSSSLSRFLFCEIYSSNSRYCAF